MSNKFTRLFTLRSDGRYQGSYVDEAGKRHYVCDKDPQALYYKLLDRKTAKPKQDPTFSDIAEEWEGMHREEITTRTWVNYKPHYDEIVSRFGKLAIADIPPQDILRDIHTLRDDLHRSATVVKTRRSLWRMIYDYAVVHGYADYNPVSSIKLPRNMPANKRTAPTDDQIKIICQSVEKPFGLFPFLLLCTGLRKSEALALRWDDIDFATKTISVNKSINYTNGAHPVYKETKTSNSNRDVPILDILLPALKKEKESSASELVFPSSPSNRGGKGNGLMPERAYEGAWLRYCQAAGLMDGDKPALTAHQLRHGTATLMFEAEVDELTAQHILGHSRVEITREIYTELRAKQKIKSIDKLNDKMAKIMANDKK